MKAIPWADTECSADALPSIGPVRRCQVQPTGYDRIQSQVIPGYGSLARLAVALLARRQLGGQTGDVLGAAEQVADAHCVMHVHTTPTMAVCCLEEGLSWSNFYAAQLWGQVAYHDFEGITVHEEEKPRLVSSLGDKNILILRNHGLLTCGTSVAEAFAIPAANASTVSAFTGVISKAASTSPAYSPE